ncbi:putative telomere length regulator protein [Talaromyces proteolyticus]|uniref:Telomere length regulator protein n=1 Tax=Talaromyces proteolyticus TaxID=1131652 RepID=A0AAD4KV98_9EURO|nr:putative telomere length regulator protein [Talaromyces proteolyticus]KAH8700233.1 putative telomere length regulator protein [Talaromyces proteolyticus]
MVEILALPARPPTPPRASHALFSRDGDGFQGRPNVLNTPGESPSTAESTVLRSSKKVNFSPITSYIKPLNSSNSASAQNSAIRSIPRSNERKPAKSILKTTSTTVPDPSAIPVEGSQPQTFAMLLESAMQQLAGESLSSRVDAYRHLLGTSKAYENIPEQSLMASKVGPLAQYIQRDIGRDIRKGEVVGMNVVTNALKLAMYIMWNETLGANLPDDFKIFMVDHALGALQDAKLPKTVLNHYAHVLCMQTFPPKIMTNSRVTRILAVLSDITERISGNGIISQRFGIYTRLLSQSKITMASQASLWVENLISGLLHTFKDARSKALAFGKQVSVLLGPNLNVSKAVLDVFSKEISQGRRLVSEICERMSRMMSSVESGVHVPEIWSTIVLLLRSKRFNIEKWEYFKEWVLVLQRCFNCSESSIKAQAIYGWNRFVYVITCSDDTSNSMMKMLTKPIISQFDRRKSEKSATNISPIILSSYYNLLYYAFRPSASYEHIDFIWEEYVNQPLVNIFTTSSQLNDAACKALSSLLWSNQPKPWVENKLNEVQKMEPEHLLPIDCKWTRTRIVSILRVFEALFGTATWRPGNDTTSDIAIAWTNLCKALADASSKEIKASAELMQAIASVLDIFQRLRLGAPASLNAETNDEFLDRFTFLSRTLIAAIGPSPFTEKLLLKTAQETFQADNTPTHRRANIDTNLDSPFMYIFRIVSSSGEISESYEFHLHSVHSLLEAACSGRQSRGSRLEFLERCIQLPLIESNIAPVLNRCIWEATAMLTINCLNSFPMETPRDRDGTISRDYDNVKTVLTRGLQFTMAFETWNSLLDAYVRTVRTERGERGIATLIIEPIAANLLQLTRAVSYAPLKALIGQALSLPYCQQNEMRPSLAGFNRGTPPFNKAFFPDKLFELVSKVMEDAYEQFKPEESLAVAEVIESLTSWLGSGVPQFRSNILDKLQLCLSLWLQDSNRYITSEKGSDNRLMTACRKFSGAIANVLQTTIQHDDESLRLYETVVSAGLQSVHKSTANRFIEMWNNTFGVQDLATYPLAVQTALQKLDPFVELRLPCPLSSQASSQDYEIPDLVESQDTNCSFDSAQELVRDNLKNKNRRKVRPSIFSSSPIVQPEVWNEDSLPKRPTDVTPRRRLRHDNSQIQFIAVESSPLASDMESQLLTERQREVKERQRGNTAIFLEGLRSSSPTLPSPAKEEGNLTPVQLPSLRDSDRVSDVLLTPTLAPNLQENDDEFPGSSPTPGAKDRVASGPQQTPAMQIEALDDLQANLVLSPEAQSRRARRRPGRPVRKASALQRSESYASDPENQTVKHGGRRRSTRNTKIQSSEPNEDSAAVHKTQSNKLQELATYSQDVPELEDTPIDVIPDTYNDEFEKQLASQLGQDLELAVDMQDIENSPSSSGTPLAGPAIRKRKRDANAEISPMPVRGKRRSLRHKAADAKDVERKPSEDITARKLPTDQPGIGAADAETPQPSPAKNSRPSEITTDNVIISGSRSRRHHGNDASNLPSSPAQVSPPSLKRRRSLRLNGVGGSDMEPALDTPKSKPQQSPSKSVNENPSSPLTRSSARKSRASMVSLTRDIINQAGAATNDVETESTRLEVSDQAIEALPEHQPQTAHIGYNVDVSMEDATSSIPSMRTDREESSNYVSLATQTDGGVENNGNPANNILDTLRKVLDDVKNGTFGREVLREMDDLLFDIRVEAIKRSHT